MKWRHEGLKVERPIILSQGKVQVFIVHSCIVCRTGQFLPFCSSTQLAIRVDDRKTHATQSRCFCKRTQHTENFNAVILRWSYVRSTIWHVSKYCTLITGATSTTSTPRPHNAYRHQKEPCQCRHPPFVFLGFVRICILEKS